MARTARKKAAPKQLTTAQRLGSLLKSARDIMRKDKGLNGDLDRLPLLTWIMFLKFLDDLERQRGRARGARGQGLPADRSSRRIAGATGRRDADGITGPTSCCASSTRTRRTAPMARAARASSPTCARLARRQRRRPARRDRHRLPGRRQPHEERLPAARRHQQGRRHPLHLVSDELHTLGAPLRVACCARCATRRATPASSTRRARSCASWSQVTNPRLGETVLDPACGTGGFLVEAFTHLERAGRDGREAPHAAGATASSAARPKPLPYLLSQMNLLLHGLDAPRIDPGNALRFKLTEIGEKERVDVILTNPPFGGEEETGIQGNFPEDRQTAETALLFLQLIMRRLKRAGRGRPAGRGRAERHAVRRRRLRPDQGGAAQGVQPAHHRAPARRRVRALHRHPDEPALLRPRGPTKEVWYYEQPLPEGRKNYTKTAPMPFEEFAACLAWWNKREENERAWKVPAADLIQRDAQDRVIACNLDIKNPHSGEVEDHRAPAEIVDAIIAQEQRILGIMDEIKAALAERV